MEEVAQPVIDRQHAEPWDRRADVVVVGSGGSGLVAALMAADAGASVLVLEKAAAAGGTTAKSSGGTWVPNNRHMRELGIDDPRDSALRYMARTARPHRYAADLPTLGLPHWEYDLLEAFYDHGAEAFDSLEAMGGMLTLPLADLPNYYPAIAEDEVKVGRSLCPATPDGEPADGPEMVGQLRAALEQRGGEVLLGHRVTGAVTDDRGGVVGVVAKTAGGSVSIEAARGVVFASGGFTHNVELRDNHLAGPMFGGCAALENEGDFVPIAQRLGAAMRCMNQAWNAPVLVERALARDPALKSTFNIVGDSILSVNRHGDRVMNEKAVYHEAVSPMLAWDGVRCEYPNLLMFPVWDLHAEQDFGGNPYDGGLLPPPGPSPAHVVEGDSLPALAAALDERLAAIAHATGGVRLDEDFADRLAATVERFNGFAREGSDLDFQRGDTEVERSMHELNRNAVRLGTTSPSTAGAAGGTPTETVGNPTMAPLAATGPYFASILGPGTLDTKGGPMTNRDGQVLDEGGRPIAGLYAVGNCAASPSAHGYWGAGATLGPMITFAWLAGQHAARAQRVTA